VQMLDVLLDRVDELGLILLNCSPDLVKSGMVLEASEGLSSP
jgi:hypothetical protein